ncbi:ATP-binding protein [Methanorbis furvi]
MSIVPRNQYMQKILPYKDQPFIKVITGIRRCGKSAILSLLQAELLSTGIPASHIIRINFENLDYAEITSAKELDRYVKVRMTDAGRYYVLLDEIQEVEQWEKAVNSLLEDDRADIYLTGSNSRLLSSELATYIAGRYVEIPVQTLSFSEYLEFVEHRTGERPTDIHAAFLSYLRLGGFPVIHTAEYSPGSMEKIVYDIYSSAILRDTVQRYNIRNIDLLERIVGYVFENVGNIFSAKNVADYFKSQHRKADLNTIYNYLNALESAFIIRRIPRYDLRGREVLATMEKYYVGDVSLIYALMGYKDRMIAGILENLVMQELSRRGYRVFVGKQDVREVDFVAERQEERVYVQVCFRMESEETAKREFAPLLEIRDHYPKFVVSMDEVWRDNVEGVRHVHIADFLLMDGY